jgi:hypothetical protein
LIFLVLAFAPGIRTGFVAIWIKKQDFVYIQLNPELVDAMSTG